MIDLEFIPQFFQTDTRIPRRVLYVGGGLQVLTLILVLVELVR